VTNPVELGSGGYSMTGAGAIIVSCAGAVVVTGVITADGFTDPLYLTNNTYSSAGGSVNIRTNQLLGTGSITANGGKGGNGYWGSSGGRIAVRVAQKNQFGLWGYEVDHTTNSVRDTLTILACGGLNTGTGLSAGYGGAAGTVYLQNSDQGENMGQLVIDNRLCTNVTDTTGNPHPETKICVVRTYTPPGGGTQQTSGVTDAAVAAC